MCVDEDDEEEWRGFGKRVRCGEGEGVFDGILREYVVIIIIGFRKGRCNLMGV